MVVRALKNDKAKVSYQIKKNDIIKLGRVEFRVKDIQTSGDSHSEISEDEYHYDAQPILSRLEPESTGNDSSEENTDTRCRICWDRGDAPLIHFCRCNGSIKYFHLGCLKAWLKSQSKPITSDKLTDSLSSMSWKKFECELCKRPHPYSLKDTDGKYHSLYDIEKPEGPLLLLESQIIDDKKSTRMVFMIKPQQDNMSVSIGKFIFPIFYIKI